MEQPIAGQRHLDVHETPPQELKDLFKSWKAPSATMLEQLDNTADNMVSLGSIPATRVDHALKNFSKTSDHDLPNEVPVYGCPDLPGLFVLPALLPPLVQRDLLARLLHHSLSDPKHMTNLHFHHDISYPENESSFFSLAPSTVAFLPKDETVHKPLSIKAALERKLRWVTLGGQYDWTNKVYPSEIPPSFPKDIAGLIQGIFPDMEAQAAIVNLYSPNDTLSLHRDVSEEIDKGLVSISLGCDAIFMVSLGNQGSSTIGSTILRLRSGDALYMTGESRFAWHAVPKIIRDTCPVYLSDWPGDDHPAWKDWMAGKRINLNVRQMRESGKAPVTQFLS